MQKRLVLILGGHRSGTSLVSRALKTLNIELGNRLIPGLPENPKGFWEDVDFKDLNQEMLKFLGRDWDNINWLEPDQVSKELTCFREKALDLVEQKFVQPITYGLKDPRFCILLPFWNEIFKLQEIEVSYLIVIRNPLDVAESLAVRNGFQELKSFYLYLQHLVQALSNLKTQSFLVVNYDSLIENTLSEIERINSFLPELSKNENDLQSYISEFVDQKLRHHRNSKEKLISSKSMIPELKELYLNLLKESSNSNSAIDINIEHNIYNSKKLFETNANILDLMQKESEIIKQEQAREKYNNSISLKDNQAAVRIEELSVVLNLLKQDPSLVAQIKSEHCYDLLKMSNLFDGEFYYSKYPELKSTVSDPLQHFVEIGSLQGLQPNAFFDMTWYQVHEMKGQNVLTNGLLHYLIYAKDLELSPHPLLCAKWYYSQYPSAKNSQFDLITYYMNYGIAQQDQPHPLFKSTWYLEEYADKIKIRNNLLLDFIEFGGFEGRNPHPLFDCDWYFNTNPILSHVISTEVKPNPLVHYLHFGYQEGLNPNPYFSTREYIQRYPESVSANIDPLSHYLINYKFNKYEPERSFNSEKYKKYFSSLKDQKISPFEHVVCQLKHLKTPRAISDSAHPSFFSSEINVSAVNQFISAINTINLPKDYPLVSIIMPSYNRKQVIGNAINSILLQTYQNWELIIVDDGSTDDTLNYIKNNFKDPRILYVKIEKANASYARNIGIELAHGEWITYLDTDNQWVVNFLELMLKYVHDKDADFAYSGIQLETEDRSLYLMQEFNYEKLKLSNFIDLNSILHKKNFFHNLGGFDTELAKFEDWDLALRYTKFSNVLFANFIGVLYDGRKKIDRVSIKESDSWTYVVINKHLNNFNHDNNRSLIKKDKVSIILPATSANFGFEEVILSILENTNYNDFELFIIDSLSNTNLSKKLAYYSVVHQSIKHLICPSAKTLALAFNYGALASQAELIVLLDPRIRVSKNWLNLLVSEIKSCQNRAVEPEVQLVDGEIYKHPPFVCKNNTGTSIEYLNSTKTQNIASSSNLDTSELFQGLCVLLHRKDFIEQGGLNPILVNQYLDLDLTSKFKKQTLRCKDLKITYYPDLSTIKNSQIEEDNLWALKTFYQSTLFQLPEIQVKDMATELMNDNCSIKKIRNPKMIVIKVSAPNDTEKHLWGDYHFGSSLAKALSNYGYEARVELASDWYKNPPDDRELNLLLRGITDYKVNENSINLAWIISHPNLVDLKKLNDFNHVFVGSNFYVNYLNEKLGNKVSLLLQASDSSVFYPDLSGETYDKKLLFVGNSRNQYRRIVEQILSAKLNLEVHGSGWEQFIPKDFIKSAYIENAELGKYYRKANLIINDHWQDMRDLGFVSNRIFDALASGVPVLTDQIIGLPEEFIAYVRILNTEISDPEQIRHLVNEILNKSKNNQSERIELAQLIHREHSFEQRAEAIISVIEKL